MMVSGRRVLGGIHAVKTGREGDSRREKEKKGKVMALAIDARIESFRGGSGS
jgi:hypothetical protein